MANANQLAVVGDVITFRAQRRYSIIQFSIKLNGAVMGANGVVLEGRMRSDFAWTGIKVQDAATKTDLAAGVGATTDGQILWAENNGLYEYRVRLASLTSGGPIDVAVEELTLTP